MTGLICLIKPDNYDWKSTRAIALSDSDEPSEGTIEVQQTADNIDYDDKKDEPTGEAVLASDLVASDKLASPEPAPLDVATLQRVFVRATIFSSILALII